MPAARIFLQLIADFVVYLGLLTRPRKAIAAENLFLRRQLALYQQRKVDPRRIDPATRITLALLSRLFNWRDALVVVQPKTLIRWHRAGFRLLWHWKSKPGRPPIPAELRRLIRKILRRSIRCTLASFRCRSKCRNIVSLYGVHPGRDLVSIRTFNDRRKWN